MVRTQIYLTEKERDALLSLSSHNEKKLSELIREAVDDLIEKNSQQQRKSVIERAAGLWKERTDLPDFAQLRKSWDRNFD